MKTTRMLSFLAIAMTCLSLFGFGNPYKDDPLQWYWLRNITIPEGSPHRNISDKSPTLFVQIKVDGKEISKTTAVTGWRADFDKSDTDNFFPIRTNSEARYTLEIWDTNGWWFKKHLFTISLLKGEDFEEKISEKTDDPDLEKYMTQIEWKPILESDLPEKFKETKKD